MHKLSLFAVIYTPYYRLQCAQQKRLRTEANNQQADLPFADIPTEPSDRYSQSYSSNSNSLTHQTVPSVTISIFRDVASALLDDSQIIEINPAAEAAGINTGITPSLALARVPELQLYTPEVEIEKQQQEALLQLCYRYSPFIESTSPGVCTLDLRGRRNKNQEIWARNLLANWRSLGFTANIGIGPNVELAAQAAKFANPYLEVGENSQLLRSLPLESLQPSAYLLEILHNWGIRTLGALIQLPKEDIGQRLGLEGLSLWDRAAGRSTKVLHHLQPPEIFQEIIDLEQRLETLEPLLFILRRSLEHLVLRVDSVYRLVAEIKLKLHLDNGYKLERSLPIPAPTLDITVLFRVLSQYLETVQTTAPVVGFTLEVFASDPAKHQFDLFYGGLKDPNRFFQTLARLAALVGNNRAGIPERLSSYKPDNIRLRLPAFDWKTNSSTSIERDQPGIGPALRRYRPPISATVELADGKPILIHSRLITGRIDKQRGPWKTSGNWWDPDRWEIQEWDVQVTDGGIYRLTFSAGNWAISGVYD
jgi:protein ImuB